MLIRRPLRSIRVIAVLAAVFIATGAAVAIAGCASPPDDPTREWRPADGTTPDADQLRTDQLNCMSEIGPAPSERAPMITTRNRMIDCMRRKGWVRR